MNKIIKHIIILIIFSNQISFFGSKRIITEEFISDQEDNIEYQDKYFKEFISDQEDNIEYQDKYFKEFISEINKEKKTNLLSSSKEKSKFEKFIKNIEDTVYRFLLENTTSEKNEDDDVIFKDKVSKEEIIKMQYGGKNNKDKYFYYFGSLVFLDYKDLQFALKRSIYDDGEKLRNFEIYMKNLHQLNKEITEFNKDNNNNNLKNLILDKFKNNSLRKHELENKIGEMIEIIEKFENYEQHRALSKYILKLGKKERENFIKEKINNNDNLRKNFLKYMLDYIKYNRSTEGCILVNADPFRRVYSPLLRKVYGPLEKGYNVIDKSDDAYYPEHNKSLVIEFKSLIEASLSDKNLVEKILNADKNLVEKIEEYKNKEEEYKKKEMEEYQI